MSDMIASIILGIVEGLTEYLPISSTAHLRIVQHGALTQSLQDEFWKVFAIVIQLGAILSVLVFYRRKISELLKHFLKLKTNAQRLESPLGKVLVAFVVTAIPAFLMSKIIGKNLESLKVIGCSLLFGGIWMIAVERLVKKPRIQVLEKITLSQAVGIGLIQILSAVFPGVSRSMATITGGQVLGLSRSAALEFSFFVAIPTMMAATSYELMKTFFGHGSAGSIAPFTSEQWLVLFTGFVVSFVVAFAVIAWLLKWVRNHDFIPFGLYRIALGLFVLFYL